MKKKVSSLCKNERPVPPPSAYEKPDIIKISGDIVKDAKCLAGRGSGCSWK